MPDYTPVMAGPITNFWLCSFCGGLVGDTERHNIWHEGVEVVSRMAEEGSSAYTSLRPLA